jgi:hypothetical protein
MSDSLIASVNRLRARMNDPYFLSMPVERQMDQETLLAQLELELSRLSSTPSSSTSSSTIPPTGEIHKSQWPARATNTNIVGNNNTTNVTNVYLPDKDGNVCISLKELR